MELTLDLVADVSAILASLAVIVTAMFAFKQLRLLTRGDEKDERRFMRESIRVIHETLQASQFRKARQRFFAGAHQKDFSVLEDSEKGYARYILSIYGLLSRMVKHGAVDEHILQEYWESALYRDWDRLENFVSGERLRSKNGHLFNATEKMVVRWKKRQVDTRE